MSRNLGKMCFKDLSNEILGNVIDSHHDDFKRELSKVWNGTLWHCQVRAFVKVRAATDVATTLNFCHNNKVSTSFFKIGNVFFTNSSLAIPKRP